MQNPLRYEIQTALRNHLRPERGKQDRGRQCQAAVGCREITHVMRKPVFAASTLSLGY
jgi:hypothetical protein